MSFLRHAALLAWKDLRVEMRTREIVYLMLFFAAMVILIFSFAFAAGGVVGPELAGGMLWVAVVFAGTLGLGRAFERERENDTMRGLLLTPSARGALFLGKALGVILFMLPVELAVLFMVAVLFRAPIEARPLELAALLLLVTIAFATVGSVFAGMLLRSRAREVLLAVILYPILVPAVMGGAKGTAAIWQPVPELAVAHWWIMLLAVFDAIFLSVALWAFESLVVE